MGHSEYMGAMEFPKRGRELKAVFGDIIDVWRNTPREVCKTNETHMS